MCNAMETLRKISWAATWRLHPTSIMYHCVSHNTGRCAAFHLYNTHCVSHNTGRATHDSMCGYRIWGAARHTIHHGSQKKHLVSCIKQYTTYQTIHHVSQNTLCITQYKGFHTTFTLHRLILRSPRQF